ncbi:phosphatase PAP2 family protein [Nocardioides mesophilus]|uniref:Phosphatase PAP2 family protein n=1 Tax=Nocardioides mesophilus TaxID=433659 RepID=A0A7G9RD50_9ACTN|nr:phosphatase PAP2 family protein [Nocardioides mesophilus]QNN53525.1 phosphatase PAP2 family protein [Nocardioides mesophilus]
MREGSFRFAVVQSVLLAAVAVAVALTYHLPLRDPDGVSVPTYIRLPVILLITFLTDVVPRAVHRAGSVRAVPSTFVAVVRERWPRDHVRFALVGLGAWYLTYVAFRNLKSYVPFVNGRLWDDTLARIDRALWFGHNPAAVLHDVLGTGVSAHVLSFFYVAWIVLVPASLVVALVWSRNVRAGEWFVTAVAVDWVLGVATYFLVPTLGPVYADPRTFAGLPTTWVSGLQETMIAERFDVLVDPFDSPAVQTIAAFASLHVGICVTTCLMAVLLGMRRWIQALLWAFLAVTVVATVYLGWHYFADTIGGAVIGAAGVLIAAWGTGNHVRGVPRLSRPEVEEPQTVRAEPR